MCRSIDDDCRVRSPETMVIGKGVAMREDAPGLEAALIFEFSSLQQAIEKQFPEAKESDFDRVFLYMQRYVGFLLDGGNWGGLWEHQLVPDKRLSDKMVVTLVEQSSLNRFILVDKSFRLRLREDASPGDKYRFLEDCWRCRHSASGPLIR